MDGTSPSENPAISTETNETSVNSPPENTTSTTNLDPSQSKLALDPFRTNFQPKKSNLWQPGQSGNPAGKPKGTKNQITLLKVSLEQYLREEASDHMHDVLMKAIKMAKNGHPGMIKLLLDLHISKAGNHEEATGDDKITININSMPDSKPTIDISKDNVTEVNLDE
jgi:hypothetical protein